MIKKLYVENFRNLNGNYEFKSKLNIIFGKNNSGKTNLLDAIKLAFARINGDYFKISDADFKNSDDSNSITIKVKMEPNDIPSFNYFESDGTQACGFMVRISKRMASGKYERKVFDYLGNPVDQDIYLDDNKIPQICSLPLIRTEEIYSNELVTGLSKFIESEEEYKNIREDSRKAIKEKIKEKVDRYKTFCKKFNQDLDIELSEAKITDEKVYIVDGPEKHNYIIGSGYKSIANIMLNSLNDKFSIVLIDEIENHLHPSLIRTLIRDLRDFPNVMTIATTHSPVVINELKVIEIIDSSGKRVDSLNERVVNGINRFLHPGRGELIFADNVVLVEGYTEELLFKHYLGKHNMNWTVINVAGIMFEPYIELGCLLNKRIVVISDNDISLSDKKEPSSRFNNLKALCEKKNIKFINTCNTLETDLKASGFLGADFDNLLKKHEKHPELYVAKEGKKTEIVQKMIEKDIDLDTWDILKQVKNEFASH